MSLTPTTPATGVIIDPLTGQPPTWRMDPADEPIYREVMASLGLPSLLVPPTGRVVVAGELATPPTGTPLAGAR